MPQNKTTHKTTHEATIEWTRASADFQYKTYNRGHLWRFADGQEVRASAAPAYLGDPGCVDPEEAMVAALSSCHMLTFLAIAAKRKLVVDRYTDRAAGILENNAAGKLAITRVTLRPEIAFSGPAPTADELAAMHREAHEHCFIANSVRTEITIE